MIRFEVALSPQRIVTVALAASDPDEKATVEFDGHPDDVDTVRDLVFASHGIDGRLIEERTTPVDLDVAMSGRWLRELGPKRLEGDEILARYVRQDVR